MGTSYSAGQILYDHADLGADRFVDTALMRDCLDSALHKADEAGQVRLHYAGEVKCTAYSTIYGDQANGELLEGTATDPVWYYFGLRARYAPKLRADGRAYPLRVRVGGCASGAGTVDFAIAVVASDGGVALSTLSFGSAPENRKTFMGITSTTPAWLTPDDGSNLLTIPASLVETAYRVEPRWTTSTDIGGDPTVVVIPSLMIVVLGASRTAGVVPRLYAAHAAEHVGAT